MVVIVVIVVCVDVGASSPIQSVALVFSSVRSEVSVRGVTVSRPMSLQGKVAGFI